MAGIDIGYELSAFIPSIGVGLLFWFGMRSIFRADRAEREAAADWERTHRSGTAPAEDAAPERSES